MNFGQPVALVTRTRTGYDSDGNPVYGVTFTLTTGGFAPGGAVENDQGQVQVVAQPTLYPDEYDVDLTAVDAIVIDPQIDGDQITTPESDWYEVDGKTQPWQSPFTGWQAGTAIPLKQVTG
jgi:hypothetical protein